MGGSASHFGLEGEYYSYYNNENYRMIEISSVGQYANRKYKNKSEIRKMNLECNCQGRNGVEIVRSGY